jgi:NarL family two-component system response regulator YdfI
MQIAIIAPILATRVGIRSLLNSDGSALGVIDHQIIFDGANLGDMLIEQPNVDLLIIVEEAVINSDLIEVTEIYQGGLAILVLSDQPSMISVLDSLPIRCWGLIHLDARAQELIAAVYALEEGLLVGSPNLLKEVWSFQNKASSEDQPNMIASLTERELEVLDYLSRGLANKQIALALELSEHTIKFHLSSIYTKMGVANRAEAVRYGIQHGLVSL